MSLLKKKIGVLVSPSTTLSWVNKGVKLSMEPIKVPNQRTIQKKNMYKESICYDGMDKLKRMSSG
jgi:hypothetical protein